eukprot:TRINITY_DN10523_c0_g1_i11.p1 TRINITY_DN10523_c0_g1~~TRINITY_DN10523_c0_g1_i11.p1  ORF type:complete len:150 (+),score=3.62 TRINITY_DN10523_c0_g1_i11:68-517(+)
MCYNTVAYTYLTFFLSFLDLLFSICVSFICSLNLVLIVGLLEVALRTFSAAIGAFFSEYLPFSLVFGAGLVAGLLLSTLCFTSLDAWCCLLDNPAFVLRQVILRLEFWLEVTGLRCVKGFTQDRLYCTSSALPYCACDLSHSQSMLCSS